MTTKGHIVTDKIISVKKYVLYLVVLAAVSGFFLLPKLFFLLTYRKTEGATAGCHDEWVPTKRGGYTNHYPLIRFNTEKEMVTFAAPAFLYEESRDKVTYPVIYNAKDPGKAYVFTFMGFLGRDFLYLGPFILIWSAFLLGPGFLPDTIRINLTRMHFVK